MSWAAAGALSGLVLVLLPVLIHLMGRAPARVRRFPSLRFLDASRLLPSKRSKLQDPLLLLLRAAILVLAAFALAGPVFAPDSAATDASARASVVIIDTSASVRREAARALIPASPGAVIEAARPGDALAGANAWLRTQRGAREIVVISDFQAGALDTADVTGFAPGTTLRLLRAPSRPPQRDPTLRLAQGGSSIGVRTTLVGESAEVSWQRIGPATDWLLPRFGTPAELADAALAVNAANAIGRADASVVRQSSITLLFTGAAAATTAPLSERWQGDVVARVVADSLFAETAALEMSGADSVAAPAIVIARGLDGRPIVSAASNGAGRLLFFVHARASSVTAMALHAAITREPAAWIAAELEPRTLTDTELAHLSTVHVDGNLVEREPDVPLESPATRWLWILALAFLAIEWLVRNRLASARSAEAMNAAG